MNKENKDINWVEIMEKFSTHKGKIVDFCKENNISPQQLYRRRKKLNQVTTQTFHAIDISNATESHSYNEEIKIEIGNAKIFIPKGDKATLIYILKELSSIC
jgi:predicted adenine nucleotide alpha hydrolase (AANH) superfamily ATPase